jgi:hypothetical protein
MWIIRVRGKAARMAKVEVIRAGLAEAEALLERGLRPSDEIEILKTTALPPAEALRLSVLNSGSLGAFTLDGKICALFGVGRSGPLSDVGVPWIVGHEDFERPATGLVMLRLCGRFVRHWAGCFKRLENLADPDNRRALYFLRHLGFAFDWERPVCGPLGHRLIRFWR